MAGTFKGPYNSNNDSDRISEELFDAFNLDDSGDDREVRRKPKRAAASPSGGRKSSPARKKRKKKDRQLMVMVELSVLIFLLITGILCGFFIFDMPIFPLIAVLVMNLAIGLILGCSLIIAPILIIAVEIAAGVFAGQLLMTIFGVVLLALAQVFCYLLR